MKKFEAPHILTIERLGQIAHEAVLQFADEFGPQIDNSFLQVVSRLRADWSAEFHPANTQLLEFIADGQARHSLESGHFHSVVRDSVATAAMNAELGEELPALFRKAEIDPIPVVAFHAMPKGIPMMYFNLHAKDDTAAIIHEEIQTHPDFIKVTTKDEKLAFLAHEFTHRKLGHTASTRTTEFAADEGAVVLTRNPRALKSGLDKMDRWSVDQAIIEAKAKLGKLYPDEAVAKVLNPSAVWMMHNVADTPLAKALLERINESGSQYGMEHPRISERKRAIDAVAARLGIDIPQSERKKGLFG